MVFTAVSSLDEKRYRELVSREAEVKELRERIEQLRTEQFIDPDRLRAEILEVMPDVVELIARKRAAKKANG